MDQRSPTRIVPDAEVRGARLSASLSGTNLERAGDYNQRIVLQAIRLGGTTTRVALARQTGLTAPTIANITTRLVELGLVRQNGRKSGGRGQPALNLEVDPDGAYAIGLNIDRDHLTLATLDLAGEVRSRITREIAFAMPGDVCDFIRTELDPLLHRGRIDRNRVLGVGVALPDDLGRIALPDMPDAYASWSELDIRTLVGDVLPWPIHCDNDAAAAAIGEAQCGTALDNPSFFYLLISAGLGGGPVMDRSYHRGASARSGEIGLMPDATRGEGAKVQDTVSLSALKKRLSDAGCEIAVLDQLVDGGPERAAIVDRWLEDAVRSLMQPLIAVTCLLDPDAVLLGGRLPLPLLERLSAAIADRLTRQSLPGHPKVMPAMMAADAPAIGAAILPFLDHVLPSESILIQAGRR